MIRAAERLRGEGRLADQTMLCVEMLKYQTEKTKRLESLGNGRKPAAKRELGERRMRFWVGLHGDWEIEKAEKLRGFGGWAAAGDVKKRRKMAERATARDMVGNGEVGGWKAWKLNGSWEKIEMERFIIDF